MSSKDDVLQFLDSLDSAPAGNASASASSAGEGNAASNAGATSTSGSANQDEQSVLDFLDEITQSAASSSAAPTSSIESKSPTTSSKPSIYDASAALPSRYLQQQQQQPTQADTRSSWLGSLWSTASEAVKTTQTAVQSSVKATMESQATKNLEERVKGFVNAENIGKIGNDLKSLTLNSMTTVLDVIAPPIAEHEVVEIWLAHDMVGYVGVESLVYRAFSKVMEQTEGGDVIVHQGAGTSTEDITPENRQLNACEGYDQAVKLAKANVDHLIKTHFGSDKEDNVEAVKNPNTHASHCPVFMAIQPCRVPRHGHNASLKAAEADGTNVTMEKDMFISFVLVLSDPTHKLEFESSSQSMPAQWLLIPYEENEWVEDRMVDCIKLAVGVIAQDYVWTRMKGDELQRLQLQEAETKLQQEQQEQEAKEAPPV
ncbi:hypothetical protein BGZ46_009693 [Entomortierella lignicola]|nr:hypothetical protein BGZ46_009693 [Entomortierella lignicola]KAF9210104.1 hypothetical protein BGZ49_005500 [Haplosporangium sp. Z 27]